MSIIIGYIKDGVTYMATDTRIIDDDAKRNEVCESNYKLRKLDNGIIYGATDNKYIRQFLRVNESIFTLDKNGDLTTRHIATEIVPSLYFSLKKVGLLDNKRKDLPTFPSEILLAFKGKLFEICNSFIVYRYERYQSLGQVADYVLAALSKLDENGDVKEQLVEAMRSCEESTYYVGGPYLTIDTKEMKYELWETE